MKDLSEIFESSKENMFFKELDFFKKLDEKQKMTLFYPGMILYFASYTGYSRENAKELALLSQLLFYSIEIHEKILKNDEVNNLVILEGDHLYSNVFKKITRSIHIENIHLFTNYVRTFSEKRIMNLDGLLLEDDVVKYKYKEIARIIAEIVSKNNKVLLEISELLAELYIEFFADNNKFSDSKIKLIDKINLKYGLEYKDISEKIVKSMEGVLSEQ